MQRRGVFRSLLQIFQLTHCGVQQLDGFIQVGCCGVQPVRQLVCATGDLCGTFLDASCGFVDALAVGVLQVVSHLLCTVLDGGGTGVDGLGLAVSVAQGGLDALGAVQQLLCRAGQILDLGGQLVGAVIQILCAVVQVFGALIQILCPLVHLIHAIGQVAALVVELAYAVFQFLGAVHQLFGAVAQFFQGVLQVVNRVHVVQVQLLQCAVGRHGDGGEQGEVGDIRFDGDLLRHINVDLLAVAVGQISQTQALLQARQSHAHDHRLVTAVDDLAVGDFHVGHLIVVHQEAGDHQEGLIDGHVLAVDLLGLAGVVLVGEFHGQLAGGAVQLLGGDGLAVELIGDGHIHRQLLVTGALVVDVAALGVPSQLIAAALGEVLVTLDVFDVLQVGLIFQGIGTLLVLQPLADDDLVGLAVGVSNDIDGFFLASGVAVLQKLLCRSGHWVGSGGRAVRAFRTRSAGAAAAAGQGGQGHTHCQSQR